MTPALEHLWQHPDFERVLANAADGPGVVVLSGTTDAQVVREAPSLARHLAEQGIEFLLLNPRAASDEESSLHGVVSRFSRSLERQSLLDNHTLLALENYESVRRPSVNVPEIAQGRLQHELVGDLLTAMSLLMPFVLVVVQFEECTPGDRQALEYLSRNVFSDPISPLSPEFASVNRIHGSLVTTHSGFAGLITHDVDFKEQSATAFKQYLANADVMQQLLDATGGDVGRLADIVTHLPENARNLQWARYQTLDAAAQDILNIVVLAGEPMKPQAIKRTLALMERSEYFGRAVKTSLEQGLLKRTVAGGDILLWLEDQELSQHILESQGPALALHEALANAERLNPDEPDLAFIARHFLMAEQTEAGLKYLEAAVKRLIARGSWDEALDLLDRGRLQAAVWPQHLCLQRVDVLTAVGHYREALAEAQVIEVATEDLREFDVRIGQLLSKISEFDQARERFKRALGGSDFIDGSARLGLAECDYALGDLETADSSLQILVADLLVGEVPRIKADRLRVQAKNIRGRIAIFKAKYDQAVQIFEENRLTATEWAWEDEIARADANLGVVAMQRRDHAEALTRLNKALASHGLRGARPRAYGLVNLATIYQRLEEYHQALEACLDALRCARRSDDDVAYGVAAHNLATIYQDLGAFDRGHAIIDHLHTAHENRTMVSRWSRLVQGYLYFDQHRYHEAIEVFDELTDGANLLYQPEARLRLAQSHLELGQSDEAIRLRLSIAPEDGEGDAPILEGITWLLDAELGLSNDPTNALTLGRKALARFTDLSQRTDSVRAATLCAQALVALSRSSEARVLLENQLQEIVRRASRVPDDFTNAYFGKPDHRKLVALLQDLRGEVPTLVTTALEPVRVVTPAIPTRLAGWHDRYGDIVGESPRLHQVFRIIDRVAKSDATILVYGESGTGKELIAEALHHTSNRSRGPFVKVNCAAFVENLLLSELFGHEKGAFTGATSQKPGRFELADQGTIFLDEIGDLSPNTQVALLRVLQEGTFERVGGNSTLKVDVRVVCATNKNLEEMVQKGEFRLDLYYRLKGVVIESPALRERREDVPSLVQHFATRFADGIPKRFAPAVLKHLMRYSWPGNIRELQNFVRSILLFVEGNEVTMEDLADFEDFFISGTFDSSEFELPETYKPMHFVGNDVAQTAEPVTGYDPEMALVEMVVTGGLSLTDLKKRLEIESIKRALLEADGNVTKAAELLQMKRPRLSQIINGTEELADLKSVLVG
jgi:DNA-binding NtrC family response regulator/tetratricopeptide (TPR) repeat protein